MDPTSLDFTQLEPLYTAYVERWLKDPEARKAAMLALKLGAPYAVGVVSGWFQGRKLKEQAEHAVQTLRGHAELWPARAAVLIEPVCRYPASRVSVQPDAGFTGSWSLRLINVAPFPLTVIGVMAKVEVYASGQLVLNNGAAITDSNCKSVIKNGVTPTATPSVIGQTVEVWEKEYSIGGTWRGNGAPAWPEGILTVARLDVTGSVTLRGPWEDTDQPVPFGPTTVWLPLQGVQGVKQPG